MVTVLTPLLGDVGTAVLTPNPCANTRIPTPNPCGSVGRGGPTPQIFAALRAPQASARRRCALCQPGLSLGNNQSIRSRYPHSRPGRRAAERTCGRRRPGCSWQKRDGQSLCYYYNTQSKPKDTEPTEIPRNRDTEHTSDETRVFGAHRGFAHLDVHSSARREPRTVSLAWMAGTVFGER